MIAVPGGLVEREGAILIRGDRFAGVGMVQGDAGGLAVPGVDAVNHNAGGGFVPVAFCRRRELSGVGRTEQFMRVVPIVWRRCGRHAEGEVRIGGHEGEDRFENVLRVWPATDFVRVDIAGPSDGGVGIGGDDARAGIECSGVPEFGFEFGVLEDIADGVDVETINGCREFEVGLGCGRAKGLDQSGPKNGLLYQDFGAKDDGGGDDRAETSGVGHHAIEHVTTE